jgi:hypothetical protein
MMKNMAVAAIIVGVASLVAGVAVKLVIHAAIAGISPSGFCQGAVIFLLLSINFLILDKHS